MKRLAALAVFVPVLCAAPSRGPMLSVTGVRVWQQQAVTRVVIEVSGEFEYRSDRLHSPERIYFDIINSRPWIGSRRLYSEPVNDELLKRIRVAARTAEITRIVLDLGDNVEATPSQLINPSRLIVELHASVPLAPPPVISTLPPLRVPALPAISEPKPPVPAAEAPGGTHEIAKLEVHRPPDLALPPAPPPFAAPPAIAPSVLPPVHLPEASRSVAPADLPKSVAATLPAHAADVPRSAPATPPAHATDVPKSARLNSSAETSLVRTLGLKINRVVIDPGHGGHDDGTKGAKGLLEKDLVLDVALRLGKLIEQRLGAEVIYTRTDDTFVPLEGRTELANDKKADLFLSIHANSSPSAPHVTGIETYYLNFTQSKDALEVAARENASSEKSVFELRDLIQKITLHDKAEESREFAERIQASLYALSARNFPGEKNRGVRKAPFVVLIGANMPSVLAEIGFLTNSREESLLRRPDYRQKLAEALYRGISRYADGLSHFQVAKN